MVKTSRPISIVASKSLVTQRHRWRPSKGSLHNTSARRGSYSPSAAAFRTARSWPSCFVEKGYIVQPIKRRSLLLEDPGDSVLARGERRPDANALTCHPDRSRSRTSLPVRLSFAYRHFLAEDVNRREVRGPSDALRISRRTQRRHRFDPLVAQKNDQSGAQNDRDVEPK